MKKLSPLGQRETASGLVIKSDHSSVSKGFFQLTIKNYLNEDNTESLLKAMKHQSGKTIKVQGKNNNHEQKET